MRFHLPLCLLFTGFGYASPNQQMGPMVQTITAEEIAHAGIMRVADILLLADEWDLNTTDAFTWKIVAGGLGTLQQQHWEVFLDNQKLDARFFDTINLNLLGITLSQIDSVHIGSMPSLVLGEFASSGFVRFFTHRQRSGWGLNGNVNMGNETGDPGPFVYTDLATPNVDRTGPSAEATLAHGSDNGQEVATLLVQQHPYTDIALAPRTMNYGIGWPGLYHVSPTLTINRKLFGGWQQFRTAIGYATSFFNLSEALGHEMPIDLLTADIGITGEIPRTEQKTWKYRLIYTSHEMSEAANEIGFLYNWKQEHISGNVELALKTGSTDLIFGAGMDRYRLVTDDQLNKDTYYVSKAYSSITGRLAPSTNYAFSALITMHAGEIYGNLIGNIRCQAATNSSLSLNGAYNQDSPATRNIHLKWLWEGYDLYNWIGYSIGDGIVRTSETMPDLTATKQYSIDMNWDYRPHKQISLTAGISYRRIDELMLEVRKIAYDPITRFFPTGNSLALDQNYQILGERLSASGTISPQFSWKAMYRHWKVLKSSTIASQEWGKIPSHKLTAKLNWKPIDGFSMWLMITLLSSTYWANYGDIDGALYPVKGESGHAYSANVPSWTNIDVQLRKQLWHRRLAATVLLRNLLDQDIRYHPIGGTFHLTLHIKIELALESGAL